MRANVYVDAFNLYYGCLRGTPYKWLDLDAFARALLPKDQVVRIRYFTALVSARPDDPQQAQRQQTYLRALATLPKVRFISGTTSAIRCGCHLPIRYLEGQGPSR